MPNYDVLRKQLAAPVFPIVPAFHSDHSLDYESTAQYVNYLVENGAGAIMLTAGTSRFNLLTNDEILELNRVVIEAVDKRAITIGANPMYGSTQSAVEFAKAIEGFGGDIILLYYPERYYGDDAAYSYFAEVAKNTSVGVMIHAMPMRHAVGGIADYSVSLCRRLVDDFESVVGMKEEHGNINHRYKLATHVGDRMTFVVAGGGMRTFANSYIYGIQGYLVGVGSFKPQMAHDFFNALKERNLTTAMDFVRQYEEAMFDAFVPMGWHVAMKAGLHVMGLMPLEERPPLQAVSDEDLEKVRTLFKKFNWIS